MSRKRNVTVAAVQMKCSTHVEENIAKADKMVREAAANGAQIILLPELFERQYFCQERRYEYYEFAKEVNENDAVKHFSALAKELSVVIPVSFYEKDVNRLFNTVAVIDADGSNLGIYRKTHIPDDHYYQEKFYFVPGDTGFQVFDTTYGKIGAGIRWAIGSEPILECDSMPHWRRAMQGHAAANLMPVIAANRIGTEEVVPCEENGGQRSALTFYGSSFITDQTGELVAEADREKEQVILATFDLNEMQENRLSWGIFRDRRPECYGDICK